MKRMLVALTAVLATVTAVSAQTIETGPIPKVTPVILGEVIDATSHSVTVATAKGEHMVFETDSRTMMPANMTLGPRVRVEFRLMESGQHHAGRITMIQPGSADWNRLDRELAALAEERQIELANAATQSPTDQGATDASTTTTSNDVGTPEAQTTTTTEQTTGTTDAVNTSGTETGSTETVTTTETELPRTGSSQPWVLTLGAGAVIAAGLMWWSRRRRTV